MKRTINEELRIVELRNLFLTLQNLLTVSNSLRKSWKYQQQKLTAKAVPFYINQFHFTFTCGYTKLNAIFENPNDWGTFPEIFEIGDFWVFSPGATLMPKTRHFRRSLNWISADVIKIRDNCETSFWIHRLSKSFFFDFEQDEIVKTLGWVVINS